MKKFQPPDVAAQKFYLTNRRSDRWKNKIDATCSVVMPEVHLNMGPDPYANEKDPREEDSESAGGGSSTDKSSDQEGDGNGVN